MKRLAKTLLRTTIAALALGVTGSASAAVQYSFSSNFSGIAGGGIGVFGYIRPTFIGPNEVLSLLPSALFTCTVVVPAGAACGVQHVESSVDFLSGDPSDRISFGTDATPTAFHLFDDGALGAFGFYNALNSDAVLSVDFVNTVPEPASWALMLGGFGLVGSAMRRRTTLRFTYA